MQDLMLGGRMGTAPAGRPLYRTSNVVAAICEDSMFAMLFAFALRIQALKSLNACANGPDRVMSKSEPFALRRFRPSRICLHAGSFVCSTCLPFLLDQKP